MTGTERGIGIRNKKNFRDREGEKAWEMVRDSSILTHYMQSGRDPTGEIEWGRNRWVVREDRFSIVYSSGLSIHSALSSVNARKRQKAGYCYTIPKNP